MMLGPPEVPRRFKEQFPLAMILRPSQIRAAAAEGALMIPSAMQLRSRYRELEMPVAIMAGTEDRIANIERQSARLHKELPSSSFEAVGCAGHMIHH